MYLKNLSKIELSMGNRQIFSDFNMDLFLLQSGAVFDPSKQKCSYTLIQGTSKIKYIYDNHRISVVENPCDKMYFVRLRDLAPASNIQTILTIKNSFPLSIIMTGYIGVGNWTIPF